MIDDEQLDAAAAAVRALPVVTAIYSTGPVLQRLGAELAGVLLHDRPPSPVTVRQDGEVAQVHATVGIVAGAPAGPAGLAVAAGIDRQLGARGADPRHITVRISTIG